MSPEEAVMPIWSLASHEVSTARVTVCGVMVATKVAGVGSTVSSIYEKSHRKESWLHPVVMVRMALSPMSILAVLLMYDICFSFLLAFGLR
jgi:hypothetical protein